MMKDGHLLPSIFVLLPNKTEATYKKMWEQVQLLCPHANPREVLVDYEKAAISSFERTWPSSVVKGCFFHPTQNVWRKVQAEGMQVQYSQDEELTIRIRMIPAQRALFPIGMWNHQFDTAYGFPRTTNSVEAWHRSFNVTVGCQQPNIWKFLAALKREQGLVEVRLAKYIAGEKVQKAKNVLAREKVIRDLIGSYLYRPRIKFLRGIAHNFT